MNLTNSNPEQFKTEMEKMILTCLRCSHQWIPRTKEPPTVCPMCKSPYWSKPRKDMMK